LTFPRFCLVRARGCTAFAVETTSFLRLSQARYLHATHHNSKMTRVLLDCVRFQTQESYPRSSICAQHVCRYKSSQSQPVNEDLHSESSSSLSPSVSEVLARCVASGELHLDKEQKRVAKRLSRLQKALEKYNNSILFQPPPMPVKRDESENGTLEPGNPDVTKANRTLDATAKTTISTNDGSKEHSLQPRPTLQIPRGLYIYGDVGTGKTMLMDRFYSLVNVRNKQRFHFHAFLARVHSMIHALKEHDLATKGRNFSVDVCLDNNPIYRVGLQLAAEVPLLCLDEFQVTDIADAVILSQLFSVLFAKGTVVVATSNRPPTDLYEGGMNRGYFLPFIDLLQHHCIVHCINSQLDYRKLLSSGVTSFFVSSSSSEITEIVQGVISQILKGKGTPRSIVLDVGFQRSLTVSKVYGDIDTTATSDADGTAGKTPRMARFAFDELCARDLGAMEYRAIARNFDLVVLDDIPHLSVSRHNVARRFITLIDELYEGRCALLCSSEVASPKDIFQERQLQKQNDSSVEKTPDDSETMGADGGQKDVGDMRDLDLMTTNGGTPIGALASVRELAFAFERAASRLMEMTSETWWNRTLNQ
jgi:peroxisome-assembly ATPase